MLLLYSAILYIVNMKTPRHTQALTVRLTGDAKTLLRSVAEHLGISMTACLEIIIREQAEKMHLRKGDRGHES